MGTLGRALATSCLGSSSFGFRCRARECDQWWSSMPGQDETLRSLARRTRTVARRCARTRIPRPGAGHATGIRCRARTGCPPGPPGPQSSGARPVRGPPLEEDPDAGWRLFCWKRAKKKAWAAPPEIALRRLARAEELGMRYREYTLEILERGRYL